MVWGRRCCTSRGGVEALQNSALAVPQRLDNRLARLKLAEKRAQISCILENKRAIFGDDLKLDLAKLPAPHPDGVGQVPQPSDAMAAFSLRVIRARDMRRTLKLLKA